MAKDRLISESRFVEDLYGCLNGCDFELEDVLSVLKGVESVDAIPVVRCKDCKHFEQGHCCIALGEAFVDSYEPEFTCGYADPRRMNGLKKTGANMTEGEKDDKG